MTEPTGATRVFTFVVRFWRESSAAGLRWRGRIQHVESGEATSFLELGSMLQFLHSAGALAEDESLTPSGEGTEQVSSLDDPMPRL
jgi:hypothetical protein